MTVSYLRMAGGGRRLVAPMTDQSLPGGTSAASGVSPGSSKGLLSESKCMCSLYAWPSNGLLTLSLLPRKTHADSQYIVARRGEGAGTKLGHVVGLKTDTCSVTTLHLVPFEYLEAEASACLASRWFTSVRSPRPAAYLQSSVFQLQICLWILSLDLSLHKISIQDLSLDLVPLDLSFLLTYRTIRDALCNHLVTTCSKRFRGYLHLQAG